MGDTRPALSRGRAVLAFPNRRTDVAQRRLRHQAAGAGVLLVSSY